tara:strand:- start:79 stop:417 length:339 start_codon:yes stop_codon:yes gene_type:complete
MGDKMNNFDLVHIKLEAIQSLLIGDDLYKVGVFPDLSVDNKGIKNFPSDEEINTAYEARKAEYDAQAYARNRASAYPSVGDQLDMMMKDKRDSTTTHQTACEAVKTAHPKPE